MARSLLDRIMIGAGTICSAAVYFGALDSFHVDPAPALGRKKVACVGDSITYGCFVAGQPWNSYPKQLGRLLGRDYLVANFGYTNRAVIKSADYPYTGEKLYKKSLEFLPDIVIIMLGSNDTKEINWDAEAYKRDMTDLIDSYMQLDSHPEVMLMLPPPVFRMLGKERWDIRGKVLQNELLPICRRIAEEKSLALIDANTPFKGKRKLFVDGVHPTAEGARLLAEIVYKAIK
jgi:lysophospholipase L1-like esterase